MDNCWCDDNLCPRAKSKSGGVERGTFQTIHELAEKKPYHSYNETIKRHGNHLYRRSRHGHEKMFRRWWNITIPTPSLISSASGSVWVFISNFHPHEFISKMGLKTAGHYKVCPSTNATVCNVKCRCTLSLHCQLCTVLDTVLAEYLNCYILLTSWPGINLEHDKILSAKAFSPIYKYTYI